MIFITHPKLDGEHEPVQVGENAFRKVWLPRGWIAVDDRGNPLQVNEAGEVQRDPETNAPLLQEQPAAPTPPPSSPPALTKPTTASGQTPHSGQEG